MAIDQRASSNPPGFRRASALYMLSAAEIHRLHPEDFERRIQLLEFVLAGNVISRATTSEPVMNRTVPHLTKKILDSIPMSAINGANSVLLGPKFVTKRGTVRGEFVLEEQLPYVIGGGLGAGGNYLAGRLVIVAAKKILDPPPASWDDPQSGDTGSSS
ncbi:hypothetical protein ACW0JT_20410 [Arthrobacter sp. SA17]